MKCAYCHKPIIADIQAQVIIEDEFLVHEHCIKPLNKELRRIERKKLIQRMCQS